MAAEHRNRLIAALVPRAKQLLTWWSLPGVLVIVVGLGLTMSEFAGRSDLRQLERDGVRGVADTVEVYVGIHGFRPRAATYDGARVSFLTTQGKSVTASLLGFEDADNAPGDEGWRPAPSPYAAPLRIIYSRRHPELVMSAEDFSGRANPWGPPTTVLTGVALLALAAEVRWRPRRR